MDTEIAEMNHFNSLPSIFECISPVCKFRFPVLSLSELKAAVACPKCGFPTILVEVQISPQINRTKDNLPQNNIHLEILVDNVRSAHNIGSIFRTADGVGVSHLFLCGVTPTPPHPVITKTSLGAENKVPWSYFPNSMDLLQQKREQGYIIWALEACNDAIPIFNIDYQAINSPILVIIGNEVSGVDPGLLNSCDKKLLIPMFGKKESLNVSIAFAIAVYSIRFQLNSTLGLKYQVTDTNL